MNIVLIVLLVGLVVNATVTLEIDDRIHACMIVTSSRAPNSKQTLITNHSRNKQQKYISTDLTQKVKEAY